MPDANELLGTLGSAISCDLAFKTNNKLPTPIDYEILQLHPAENDI